MLDENGRTAPKGGYDNLAKEEYRRSVWATFSDAIADIKADPRLKAVIMPSHEGLEIDLAIGLGLAETDIIAIDRSAAVIATSKWRKKWPDVHFLTSEISEAGEKIRKHGWVVRCANLDLCGNFSSSTISAVSKFFSGALRSERFTLAVTVAKGREGSCLVEMVRHVGADGSFIEPRMAALMHMARIENVDGCRRKILAQGAYISGRQPMAWASQDFETWQIIAKREHSEVFSLLSEQAEKKEGPRREFYRSLSKFYQSHSMGVEPIEKWDQGVVKFMDKYIFDICKNIKTHQGCIGASHAQFGACLRYEDEVTGEVSDEELAHDLAVIIGRTHSRTDTIGGAMARGYGEMPFYLFERAKDCALKLGYIELDGRSCGSEVLYRSKKGRYG